VARSGVARDGAVRFQVYAPLYADLTGDGRPEALVPYSCTGADFGGVQLFVYTGDAAHLRCSARSPPQAARLREGWPRCRA